MSLLLKQSSTEPKNEIENEWKEDCARKTSQVPLSDFIQIFNLSTESRKYSKEIKITEQHHTTETIGTS